MFFAGGLRDYGGGIKISKVTVSRSVKARGFSPGPVSVIVQLWGSELTVQGLNVLTCEMGTNNHSFKGFAKIT